VLRFRHRLTPGKPSVEHRRDVLAYVPLPTGALGVEPAFFRPHLDLTKLLTLVIDSCPDPLALDALDLEHSSEAKLDSSSFEDASVSDVRFNVRVGQCLESRHRRYRLKLRDEGRNHFPFSICQLSFVIFEVRVKPEKSETAQMISFNDK
jgi:hypothetical protein